MNMSLQLSSCIILSTLSSRVTDCKGFLVDPRDSKSSERSMKKCVYTPLYKLESGVEML